MLPSYLFYLTIIVTISIFAIAAVLPPWINIVDINFFYRRIATREDLNQFVSSLVVVNAIISDFFNANIYIVCFFYFQDTISPTMVNIYALVAMEPSNKVF
jgi:hypothetical protein